MTSNHHGARGRLSTLVGELRWLLAQRADRQLAHHSVRRLAIRVDNRTRHIDRTQRLRRLEQRPDERIVPRQGSVDDPRFDDGHADAGVRDLLPQRVGVADLTPFARDVHRLTHVRFTAGDRGDDEDVPFSARSHVRQDGAHRIDRPEEVRLDDGAPAVGVARVSAALVGDAGVRYKDVDPAVSLERGGRDVCELRVLADVGLDGDSLPARRVERLDDLLLAGRAAVDEDEPGAARGELEGSRGADPTQPAGDDDDGRGGSLRILLYGQDDVILSRLDRRLSRRS